MEHPARQDRVEGAGTGELLERHRLEDVPVRRRRIDRHDLVTAARDGPRELTLAAADQGDERGGNDQAQEEPAVGGGCAVASVIARADFFRHVAEGFPAR